MDKRGKVLLITGPAGSGKTTLAEYARKNGWTVISEDDYWVKKGWGAGLRSSEQEKVIQQEVYENLISKLQNGENVALEFILYYPKKPNPLSNYIDRLIADKFNFKVIALKPSVEEIMKRLKKRGRLEDLNNLEARRKDALNQVACLEANYINPDWIVDPTNLSVEQLFKDELSDLL